MKHIVQKPLTASIQVENWDTDVDIVPQKTKFENIDSAISASLPAMIYKSKYTISIYII